MDETAAEWRREGLLADLKASLPFNRRLLELWHDAGKPKYPRSPRKVLVSPEMFEILSAPEFLDITQDLLGTHKISIHSVFNARPKLPSQCWTDTPWHQDAQYFREAETEDVPTFWFPLQDVSEKNSCLQIAPGLHRKKLHEGYDDPETGFLGISPEIRKTLTGIPIEMQRGDVLCFTEMTPHAALPNLSDTIRWSIDLRFENTARATPLGAKLGFVARSERDPSSVTTCEQWLARWEEHGALAY